MNARDRSLLVVALSVLLLFGPIYALPSDPSQKMTVTYEARQTDAVSVWADAPNARILNCTGEVRTRTCLLPLQAGRNGTVTVPVDRPVSTGSDGTVNLQADHAVLFADGFATLESTVENGSVRLRFRPLDRDAVLSAYATQYADLNEFGRRVVDRGSATETVRFRPPTDPQFPLERHEQYVERNGTFYYLELARTDDAPVYPPGVLSALRLGGLLVGSVCLFDAGYLYARYRDSG